MAPLVELVDSGLMLAEEAGRHDLRQRLEHTRSRLLDPSTRVLVVGEMKQGKSKLINAIVNAPICPVGDDVATAVPTVVRYGAVPTASVIHAPDENAGPGDAPERSTVELSELADHVSETGNPGNRRQLAGAEVEIPRTVLDGGLTLVDSPGVGGFGSTAALATLAALPTADAVLVVSDASQEFTEPEIQFLRQAMRICPNVACVLTKTDLYPHWRTVEDLDRAHLERLGADIPLFPVSSELRLTAGRLQDAELNAESGVPALVAYLRHDILGQEQRLQRRSVSLDLTTVADHLALSMESELAVLLDPGSTQRVVAEVEAAKERANDLRRRSARWQLTLTDGITDLISDVEHDLRTRLRVIQAEAEQAIDAGDPGPAWDSIGDWFELRTAAAISDTFIWTNERARWLADEVASNFTQGAVSLPVLRVDDTDDVLDPVAFMPELENGKTTATEKVLIGMRGSYGGVLMIGLITGVMGLALINPLSIAAGLIIGAKAYKDDKDARLKRRRAEAKALIRRQVDEVVFYVGKQLKDRLRLVQRATRDHFTDIADEYHRSLQESLLATQKAASTASAEAESSIQRLRGELTRVKELRSAAAAVDDQLPAPAARQLTDVAAPRS